METVGEEKEYTLKSLVEALCEGMGLRIWIGQEERERLCKWQACQDQKQRGGKEQGCWKGKELV